jgi:multidrug resistance efflux pump
MREEPSVGLPPVSRFVGLGDATATDLSRSAANSDARPIGAPRRSSDRRLRATLDSWIENSRQISGWKVAITLACFVGAAYFLGPRLFFTYSEEAVTNAPLVTLAPPLPGAIASLGARVGQIVRPGDTVAIVTNPMWDPTPMLDIDQRLRGAQSRVDAAETEIGELTGIRARLRGDYDLWRESETAVTATQVTAAGERLAAAQVRLVASRTNLARYEGLAPFALVNHQRLTDVRRDYDVARHDVAAAQAGLDEAEQSRQTIVHGGITLGSNDRPPTLQRIDEIDIRLATERATLATAQVDVGMLQRQRAERLRQRDREVRQVLRSPVHGMVWRIFARRGDTIAAHSPAVKILDCRRLGVSATFNQRYIERIVPGRPVSVRLAGFSKRLSGHIAWVSGYYMADNREADAIALKPDKYAPVIAWATLDEPPADCWVGLKATVRLQ